MATSHSSHRSAPVSLTGADAYALRQDLAGWTVEAISEIAGERAVRALGREQIVPARQEMRAAGAEPDALRTRLLTLGDTLTRAQAERALPQCGVDGAVRAGLLEASGQGGDDEVRGIVDIRPQTVSDSDGDVHWWIASDQGEVVTGTSLRDDHVLGVGGASVTLSQVTVRSPRKRVLDVGTGCGIQALHAARHAGSIVATDISARALSFARFNETLNAATLRDGGVTETSWDLREGSLFEPVAADAGTFDLIVSNPPFVISPDDAPHFEYRDGGMQGDGIVQHLVENVGGMLAPGGMAQMLGNWEIHDDPWNARLEGWLDAAAAKGMPLDAWIIQRDMQDASEYAETWLRDAGIVAERDIRRYAAAYDSWLRDFDARGITGIGFGIVTLRRAASGVPTLRLLEEHEGALQMPLGGHIADVLAAHDWLAGTSDEALLGAQLTAASDVTKEQYGSPHSPDPKIIIIRQGAGLSRAIHADTALAGFVGACDGELSVGQIAHALSALLDVPAGTMVSGLLPIVRDMVRDGFLRFSR